MRLPRALILADPDDPRHGTRYGYDCGCRCGECRAAYRVAASKWLYGKRHNRFPRFDIDWAKCGTASNYRAHLRRGEPPCEACRKAEARRHVDRRRSQKERPA